MHRHVIGFPTDTFVQLPDRRYLNLDAAHRTEVCPRCDSPAGAVCVGPVGADGLPMLPGGGHTARVAKRPYPRFWLDLAGPPEKRLTWSYDRLWDRVRRHLSSTELAQKVIQPDIHPPPVALLGDRLVAARLSAGLSRGQVEGMGTISADRLRQLEVQNRSLEAAELQWLADCYDVSPQWLAHGPISPGLNVARVWRGIGRSHLDPSDQARLAHFLEMVGATR